MLLQRAHPSPAPAFQITSPSENLSRLLPWMILGFAGLLLTCTSLLWRMWTTDALRSIGVYFPIVSIVLLLQVWQKLNWETRGTWWGVIPLYLAIILARQGGNALQAVAFTQHIGFTLLPLGLTVFAYGSGVVLLLGGRRLWQAAIFPLSLLLLVNPVPSAFQLVDLPLQSFCAHLAHSFALAIGVHPNVDQLRLMFAPGFGMFIAPGCDGIHGAVTMGYLALILGYIYRFSVGTHIMAVAGGCALGYVFNLIRLCSLVLFYRVALSWTWLQSYGEVADYLIGGALFLTAAVWFVALVRWKKQQRRVPMKSGTASSAHSFIKTGSEKTSIYWKGAAVTGLVVLSSLSSVGDLTGMVRRKAEDDGSKLVSKGILPQQMGAYRMKRTWSEQDWLNRIAYRWAAYLDNNTGREVDLALWLGPGVHYPMACHLSKGHRPEWQQALAVPTLLGGLSTFSFYFYEDSDSRTLEVTTVCDSGGCNEGTLFPKRTGIALASMGIKSLVLRPASSPLPILIRTQSSDLSVSSETTRNRMLEETRNFISKMDTQALIHFAESRNQ